MNLAPLTVLALLLSAAPTRFGSLREVPWRSWTYDLGEDDSLAAVAQTGGKIPVSNWRFERRVGADSFVFEVIAVDYGELAGAGEAAVVTWSIWTGGSGVFTGADVFVLERGRPTLAGRIPGGDRGDGGIYSVGFADGRVLLHRFDAAGGGACCPTRLRLEAWTFERGELSLEPGAPLFLALEEPPEGESCRTTLDCGLGERCEAGVCREAECHSGDRSPAVAQRDCGQRAICLYQDALDIEHDAGSCEPL